MATILLVDDDPLQAFVRKSTLEKRFHDVERVADAAEALCLVEQPQFAGGLGLVDLRTAEARNRRSGLRRRAAHPPPLSARARPRRRQRSSPTITRQRVCAFFPAPSPLNKCSAVATQMLDERSGTLNSPPAATLPSAIRHLHLHPWCELNHMSKAYDGLRITSLGLLAVSPSLRARIIVEYPDGSLW